MINVKYYQKNVRVHDFLQAYDLKFQTYLKIVRFFKLVSRERKRRKVKFVFLSAFFLEKHSPHDFVVSVISHSQFEGFQRKLIYFTRGG